MSVPMRSPRMLDVDKLPATKSARVTSDLLNVDELKIHRQNDFTMDDDQGTQQAVVQKSSTNNPKQKKSLWDNIFCCVGPSERPEHDTAPADFVRRSSIMQDLGPWP